VKFTDIGLAGNQPVRLLWPQKDLPTDVSNVYEATVPRHGVALVKIGRPQNRTTPPK
jgi:Alpha galactosidase C-terminal beta sandwich domain